MITILGKPMRFLKNFLRKLKLTLIFQGGYPRSGLHYNVFHFPWRSSLFIPVGHSQKRGEKTWVIQKRRNEETIQKRISSLFIPEGYSRISISQFSTFFDFSFLLGPNLGQMTSLSYFFLQSLSLFLYHFLLKYYLTYTNLT